MLPYEILERYFPIGTLDIVIMQILRYDLKKEYQSILKEIKINKKLGKGTEEYLDEHKRMIVDSSLLRDRYDYY